MHRIVAAGFVVGVAMIVGGCAADAGPKEEAAASASDELSLAGDAWYVALGRCGAANAGILASKVNVADTTPACLAPAVASPSADAVTQSAIAGVGTAGGTEMIRIDSGAVSPARVRQVFSVIAPPANPLDKPVDGLRYFQATATSCAASAIFSFTPVNDPGFLGSHVQRGWGDSDVRVNSAYDLPAGWTNERLRHEVLFEQATFRGMVERPTFDILHPFAERPLLVTVFDMLPALRSADRCATAP